MTQLRTRKGFALPMALLVMIVLTAGIAAGFSATSAEVLSNAAHRGDNRAYNLAEAGLEQFLDHRHDATFCTDVTHNPVYCLSDPASPTADSEWARIPLTGGYADVKSVLVRKYITDTLPAIYFIRSVGTDTSVKLSGGTRAVNGTRAVGMYAAWTKAVVNVQGAWFALSGLSENGAAGLIDGHDQCATADGGGATTVAGAVVPSGGQFSGFSSPFSGSPPLDSSKTFAQLEASTKLDWAGILAGSIVADFDVPTVAFPGTSQNQPNYFVNNPTAWPIIRVHSNNFTLPVAGRGMIIADSNFIISGSNMWDGVVLIGGTLTSNGNNTTAGATLSGLNYLINGVNPGGSSDNSTSNGQKTYVYNSCNVAKASAGLRVYKPWYNTWTDNVPVW